MNFVGAFALQVGTRFIASKESAAPQRHIDAVLHAGPTDTMRTLIYSGRPLRTLKTDYVLDWASAPFCFS
jgi:NAD(P)H-dependent flavin oxidoreductase YrpB (nitropropane dioxygenase family)